MSYRLQSHCIHSHHHHHSINIINQHVDPNASTCESHFPLMDDVLRSIMSDILSSIDPGSEGSNSWSSLELPLPTRPVAQRCLVYLRDRIGVPRDLSVHAAKVYRSAINRFVQQKCGA